MGVMKIYEEFLDSKEVSQDDIKVRTSESDKKNLSFDNTIKISVYVLNSYYRLSFFDVLKCVFIMVPKLCFIGDFRLSVDFGTDSVFYEDEIGIEGIIEQVEKRFSRAARSELNIKVDFSEHKVPYRMYVTQWRDFAKRIKKVIKTRDYRFELVTWEKNWKWKIGEQPFFALSMIWESYCELYKVAYEEKMTTIAVSAFSGHNFNDLK